MKPLFTFTIYELDNGYLFEALDTNDDPDDPDTSVFCENGDAVMAEVKDFVDCFLPDPVIVH